MLFTRSNWDFNLPLPFACPCFYCVRFVDNLLWKLLKSQFDLVKSMNCTPDNFYTRRAMLVASRHQTRVRHAWLEMRGSENLVRLIAGGFSLLLLSPFQFGPGFRARAITVKRSLESQRIPVEKSIHNSPKRLLRRLHPSQQWKTQPVTGI